MPLVSYREEFARVIKGCSRESRSVNTTMENLSIKEKTESCTSMAEQEKKDESIFGDCIEGDVVESKLEHASLDVKQNLWREIHRLWYDGEVYFDEAHNLVVSDTVAVCNGDGSRREHTESVTWIRWRSVQANHSLNVRFTCTRRLQVLHSKHVDSFKMGNVIDYELLGSCLLGKGNYAIRNLQLCEYLAPSFLDKTVRYDTSSLYAKGFIMMLEAEAYRRAGVKRALIPLPENNSLVIRNAYPHDDMVRATWLEYYDDLQSGAFVLPGLPFQSPKMMNVLQILACPYPRFTNAGTTGAPFCFAEMVVIPEIPIRMYCQPPVPLLPDLSAPEPEDIKILLLFLAGLRNEQDQLVIGLTRAVMWWNGVDATYGASDDAKIAVMNSLLEVGASYWSRPVDFNWMWRALNFVPSRAEVDLFLTDYSEICSFTPEEIDKYGGVVAAVISCGMSSVLNKFNLTGRHITGLAGGLSEDSSMRANNLLRNLVLPLGPEAPEVAPIYSFLCSFIGQCSSIKVSPLCWSCTKWGGIVAAQVSENDLWGRRWPVAVPYIVDPMSVNRVFERWLDVWGFVEPKVKFSGNFISLRLGGDLITSSSYGQWRANIHRGYEYALNNTPYLFVPYGLCVFNILSQALNSKDPWPVTFLKYAKVSDIPLLHTFAEPKVVVKPQIVSTISTVRPGTFLSYSWEDDTVLIPSVTKEDFGNETWFVVRGLTNGMFDNCGIVSGKRGQIGSLRDLDRLLGFEDNN